MASVPARLRHWGVSRRSLAFGLVVLVVVLVSVVATGSGSTGSRVLYLDIYSYANNLTFYKNPAPDDRWDGYRIRYEQDDGSQVTTDLHYNDYHYATDCDYGGNKPSPGIGAINGQGSFFVYSETGAFNSDPSLLRRCEAQSGHGLDLVLMAAYGCPQWGICWSRGSSVGVGVFAAELYIANHYAENQLSHWDPGTPGAWANNHSTAGVLNISRYLNRAGTTSAGLPLRGDGPTIEAKVKRLCEASATGAMVVYSSRPVAVTGNPGDQHAAEQYVIKGMNDCINAGY